MTIKVGDIVGRIKYGCDLLFRVVSIRNVNEEKIAILYGEDIRLVADAPFEDLICVNDETRSEFQQKNEALIEHSFQLFSQDRKLLEKKLQFDATDGYRHQGDFFQMPGRVLHLDGDPSYLKKCMDAYEKIGVPVQGLYCNEKEMPVNL